MDDNGKHLRIFYLNCHNQCSLKQAPQLLLDYSAINTHQSETYLFFKSKSKNNLFR